MAVGVAALAGFVMAERRSQHPLVPLDLFADRSFSVTNAATFVLYGAIGCYFFLLVIALQVIAGFSPLAAGTATLPVTVLTLLLSARSGELASRIGPRLQMSVGPALRSRCPAHPASVQLTPATGRTCCRRSACSGSASPAFVAPLTSTALSSAPDRNAGVASGVNNAVARSGTLLAVAVVPVLTGLTGNAYRDAASLDEPVPRLHGRHRAPARRRRGTCCGRGYLARPATAAGPSCRPDPVVGSPGQ